MACGGVASEQMGSVRRAWPAALKQQTHMFQCFRQHTIHNLLKGGRHVSRLVSASLSGLWEGIVCVKGFDLQGGVAV